MAGLLLWAASAVVLGEALRLGAGRLVPSWRRSEPISRLLLDFYLGGALVYLVGALPWGLFVEPVVLGLPVAGSLAIVVYVVAHRRSGGRLSIGPSLGQLLRPAYLLALGSTTALFVVEVIVAGPVGTGNTFDSGLLTTYTALLLRNHTLPLSFQPYAAVSILYPQGTTAWLGWAQLALGLPAARTSLLVTPLFLSLSPLAGFVFGRRWFSSERGGAAIALVLAWLAPATRGLVGGSNDFVFAFPLVLWLAAEGSNWLRSPPPAVADAVGFGVLAGYSAAMNPVGAEWLFPALLLGALWGRPAFGGAARRWFVRWGSAIGVALVGVLPSLVVLVEGHGSPGYVPGSVAPPPGTPTGISAAQFLGSVDPFLFRPQDVQLSPIPALRLELAILLVLGLVLLVAAGWRAERSALGRYLGPFRRFALAAGLALAGLLAVLWWGSTGFGPAVALAAITSAGEISLWIFTIYVVIAALPLVVALERWHGTWRSAGAGAERAPPSPTPGVRRGPNRAAARTLVPLAVALVIVVPGVTLTPTSFAPVLTHLYDDFGNVSSDDFALLEYAGAHLPSGARVLIAPGSAADFLPGYAANVVLLYPLVPGWEWVNASYHLVVDELSNATLDPAGRSALGALDVGYIIVTGNNTVLWPAFSPAPLIADPSLFPLLWHEGDAYLFQRV